MLRSVCGGFLVAAAAGLLAGVVIQFLGRGLRLSAWRTWIGAGVAALLVGLVVGDFSVHGAGDWWARHPTAGAAATGVLLLALTVLVVEAAVERVLRASEARRWRSAATVAATSVLHDAVDPIIRIQEILWSVSEVGRIRGRDSGHSPPNEVVQLQRMIPAVRGTLQQTVLVAAPVLTATDELHRLYNEAVAAVEAAGDLDSAILEWRRAWYGTSDIFETETVSDEEWQQQHPEVTEAWRAVMELWAGALSHLRAFEREAMRSLDVEPPLIRPWDPRPKGG